ncbi:MAG: hypothetical protein KKD07_00805 [Candidatus Omnitrophica bacterium]|nr:hypothetical protein [Candidatus Omnitrophota bacterium]MBU1995779.1 hypothetical protein [Candidatus Omnitrophota bacterium]MBU4332961.1 hypothetical protein [Candidatus Omnitrophota bacterium]
MKNKIFIFFTMVFVGLFLLVSPRYSFSQMKDFDEERLTVKKTGVSDLATPMSNDETEVLIDKELKYVAGKDAVWFTNDDDIYHYFLIVHDSGGKVLKKSCNKAGEDTVPLTSDDIAQDYQVFEYAEDGLLAKETSFDAKGKKKYTVSYSYDENGRKNKTVSHDAKNKKIRYVEFSYDANGLLVKDAEYVEKEIEKYHTFEYDESGKLIRMMECHVKENGKGFDGVWFTEDDVVSSTKELFYNDQGVKIKENKYIGAGLDGKWFTEDDVLQYYVLFEYQE